MIIEALTVSALLDIGKVTLTVMGLGSIAFGAFKVVYWIKSKLTDTNIKIDELKVSLNDKLDTVQKEIEKQTNTLVQEQRETRQTMTSLFIPTLIAHSQPTPVRAKPTRKKKV